jgi:hypothetical protein
MMKFTWRSMFVAAIAAALLFPAPVRAEEAEAGKASDAEDVAKKLSNPIADLVSLPLQFNWENGVGANDALRFVLNFQPVVPFSISKNWNLIGRFILPFVVSQPAELGPGTPATSGTGDIVLSAFLSPKKSRVTWGVGPVFGLPTTTDPLLGSGKWSIGPTVVVLKQQGPWTYGGLANHLWSFADTGDTGGSVVVERDEVSQTFLQPFLSRTSKKAITLSVNSESTYNWKADSGQKWTVPVNLSVSKVTRLGPFPFSMQGGLGYYVESPDAGPDWKLRMNFTLILPKGKTG